MNKQFKSPIPYFGNKAKVASKVWNRFGDVSFFAEPFFGSGAILFNRPNPTGREIINDKDHFVVNFWRALSYDHEEVAALVDYVVSEVDLHARHDWLVTEGLERIKAIETDPFHFDALVAAWWAWGRCCWIGRGWCAKAYEENKRTWRQKPNLSNQGVLSQDNIPQYLESLALRLKDVKILCGDWSRCVTNSYLPKDKPCAIFLDPPYSLEADRDNHLYAQEDLSIAHDVRRWCVENGANLNYRIAICGYNDEHDELDQYNWKVFYWKANSWRDKGQREVIWFSPGCNNA